MLQDRSAIFVIVFGTDAQPLLRAEAVEPGTDLKTAVVLATPDSSTRDGTSLRDSDCGIILVVMRL